MQRNRIQGRCAQLIISPVDIFRGKYWILEDSIAGQPFAKASISWASMGLAPAD